MTSSRTKTETVTREVDTADPSIKMAVMNNDIQHINTTLTRIEAKFDSAINSFVTHDKLADAISAAEATHTSIVASVNAKNIVQDKAIKSLEDWNTWAVRIVLGAVITAGLALIIVTKPF